MPPKRPAPDDPSIDDDPWTTYRDYTSAIAALVKFFEPTTFRNAAQEPLRHALSGILPAIVSPPVTLSVRLITDTPFLFFVQVSFYDQLGDAEDRPLEVEQFNFQVGVIYRMAMQRFPQAFKKNQPLAKLADLCPKARVIVSRVLLLCSRYLFG